VNSNGGGGLDGGIWASRATGLIKAAFADEATIFFGTAGAGLDGAEDTWADDLVSSEGFEAAFAAAAGSLPSAIASSASLQIKNWAQNWQRE
jgi:hypothetical protein